MEKGALTGAFFFGEAVKLSCMHQPCNVGFLLQTSCIKSLTHALAAGVIVSLSALSL
jgi:hypothetical protein